ncbi:MAG TPA: DUF3303 family protein [Dehalococcoidales bacterium]|jgi:hypothetical protein
MRYLMKVDMSNEAGNANIRDPKFGDKVQALLKELKAEAAYFATVNGQRGGYIVVNIDDASQIPAMAEPFFLWFKGNVEFIPVMLPQDLGKAGPAISAAVQKWGG